MTTDTLKRILGLAERATPNWSASSGADDNGNWCALGPEHSVEDTEDEAECELLEERATADADFIRAASPDVVAALARLALAARNYWHEADVYCDTDEEAHVHMTRSQQYAEDLDTALAAVFGERDDHA
jgi:hypothetical protein